MKGIKFKAMCTVAYKDNKQNCLYILASRNHNAWFLI